MHTISAVISAPPELHRPRLRAAVTALVLFALLASANLPTPLYPLLEQQLGVDSFGITVAFTSYVLSLMIGLIAFRRVSNLVNRRTVLMAALTATALAALLMTFATTLVVFCAARAMQGLAIAVATASGSSALRVLLPGRADLSGRLTLLATSGGVAAGPLLGGWLSAYGAPLRTPFLIWGGVLTALILAVTLVAPHAECRQPRSGQPTGESATGPTDRALAASRIRFAAAIGFTSFALFGFCLSLAPTLFAGAVPAPSRLQLGALASVTLLASATMQLVQWRGAWRTATGLALFGAGTALLTVAIATGNTAVVIASSLLAGTGQGLAFQAAFSAALAAVPTARHASTVSIIYTITYLGSTLPVLALGFAAKLTGVVPAATGFAALLTLGCVALFSAAWRRRAFREHRARREKLP